MPVNKDESGKRWVQAEVEVPGTPEQVWDAIATGPGISSWFVPTEMDQHEGGAVRSNFGPGMESLATITEWNPPHRFAAESRDGLGPDDPSVATEWIVEARDGGTCVVRVVHSWFMDSDDWDAQFEGHTYGWINFFRILRLYLEHFSGQPSAAIQVMGASAQDVQTAWAEFTAELGIANAGEGTSVTSASGAPDLAGQVEYAAPPEFPGLLLRVSKPAPGIAHLFALPMGEVVYLSTRFFLFGESAASAASTAEPAWQEWTAQHFPMG